MICRKCHQEVADGPFCLLCGTRQQYQQKSVKKRGNGQGSVYKLPNGKYKAVAIQYYFTDDAGKKHKKTRSAVFSTKKDAVAALPELKRDKGAKTKQITFKELYDKWFPTHRAGKSTLDCYKAAVRYFAPVHNMQIEDIDIEDLQECLDECGKGKRTQENMKAVCGLVYKYGIPRRYIPNNLNLSQFLIVSGNAPAKRDSFTPAQISQIRSAVGVVPYADYIYCMIYLGFRPSEFLALTVQKYDLSMQFMRGGAKTVAGTDRMVTVSPKIQSLLQGIIGDKTEGPIFPDKATGGFFPLKRFTEDCFYPALGAIGIDNPVVTDSTGTKRHKFTPHSCRHTFATLLKRVPGADKDKLELIGHTTDEMLRYYQDVDIADLKKITDQL
jgi:integrase